MARRKRGFGCLSDLKDVEVLPLALNSDRVIVLILESRGSGDPHIDHMVATISTQMNDLVRTPDLLPVAAARIFLCDRATPYCRSRRRLCRPASSSGHSSSAR